MCEMEWCCKFVTKLSARAAWNMRHAPLLLLLLRVLQFLFTEINYGGRVTDDKDRRLLANLMNTFCSPAVLEQGTSFSPSGTYAVPGCETLAQVSLFP